MVTTRSERKRKEMAVVEMKEEQHSPHLLTWAFEVVKPMGALKGKQLTNAILTSEDVAAADNKHSKQVMEGHRSKRQALEAVAHNLTMKRDAPTNAIQTPEDVTGDDNMHSGSIIEGQSRALQPSEAITPLFATNKDDNSSRRTAPVRELAAREIALHPIAINRDNVSSKGTTGAALDSVSIEDEDCFSAKDLQKSHPSNAISLNLTEIAEMGDDELSDIESELDSSLICIRRYRVKPEYASLLTSIFFKYGDIGANCSLGSVSFRSFCMEKLCEIYLKLQATIILAITEHEIKDMLYCLNDIKKAKLEVKWLKIRLTKIRKAKKAMPLLKPNSELKQSQLEKKQKVHRLKLELEDHKNKIHVTESEISKALAEALETDQVISENRAILKYVWELKELVAGLL